MVSFSSALTGAIVATLLLSNPTSTSATNTGISNDLLAEVNQLHTALARITTLLATADFDDYDAIMEKTASLVQRVQSWVSAADKHHSSLRAYRELNRQAEGKSLRKQERAKTRFANRLQRREDSGIGSAVDRAAEALEQFDQRKLEEPEEVDWDEIARDLYEQTTTFPECRERLLDDCLAIIEKDLASLGKVAELEIHNKRIAEVDGYYKVVIITDLFASTVKGQNNDGVVSYPFLWKDIEGERTIGVNGSWQCHSLSPQECCVHILHTVPNPDTHGNFLQCDFSVPYGGDGNPKRDDRVIINLSPDGRVQEDPRME